MIIAIVGHSFIRRLHNHLRDTWERHGEYRYFNFDIADCNVEYYWKGGGKVQCMKRFLSDLVDCRPDLVFLQVGGNDIRVDSIPQQIAREMVELAESIAEVTGAKVVIGSLFRRERPRSPLTYGTYEEIRDDVNFWCDFFVSHATPAVRFWAHGRLGGLHHFFGDGVHLAEAEDQELFYRSIRGAILFHGR